MEKLKVQLCELLWKHKCCFLYKNKNRDYEIRINHERILQFPYLLKFLIYTIKQSIQRFQFNCILSINKNCKPINTIIAYDLGLPIYFSYQEIKELEPLIISLSTTNYTDTLKKCKVPSYSYYSTFDMVPLKIKNIDSPIHSLLHAYELLDYGHEHKYIDIDTWELTHMYYYEKIPFEYRSITKKDIENRNLAITKCYNLLFKKNTNLILDCSGLDPIQTLKTINAYGEHFLIVIVDTDCFTTFTKKHRECFISCCKEKSLLVYDRLRIEKLEEQQISKIISRKIGKQEWLDGFFLYSYTNQIVDYFSNSFPNLGLFFESDILETDNKIYTNLQKRIKQIIGITLENKRMEWHTDSRIFYSKKNEISLEKITNKSITHSILFDNNDFLILSYSQLNLNTSHKLELIREKAWSLFKNKF